MQHIDLAVAPIVAVAVFLRVSHDGLRHSARPARPLDFVAVLYLAVVTLTAVGFGVMGRAMVAEPRARGQAPEDIVIVDAGEMPFAGATARVLVALRGDASAEAVLRAAAAEKASHVVVAPAVSGGRLTATAVR